MIYKLKKLKIYINNYIQTCLYNDNEIDSYINIYLFVSCKILYLD